MPRDPYVDRHGIDLTGEDEHGLWQGTDAWPWPLVSVGYSRSRHVRSPRRRVKVTLSATWPDGRAWDAVVLAPSRAYALEYFSNWGFLRDLTVL